MKRTWDILLNNDYPEKFINYYVQKRLDTIKYRRDNNIVSNNDIIDSQKSISIKKPKLCVPFVDGSMTT